MVKRDGHIDLVFRDGLKSLEVLPPADVWESVSSGISPVRSNAWIFRIAAGVAAMVSIGLLAYFVGMQSSQSILEPFTTESQVIPTSNSFLAEENIDLPVLAEGSKAESSAGNQELISVVPSGQNNRVEAVSTTDMLVTRPVSSGILTGGDDKFDIVRSGERLPDRILLRNRDEHLPESLLPVDPNSEPVINRDKWMLGAKVSPTYLSSSLKAANSIFGNKGGDESALLSYTGGLSVSYSVGGRLSFQTGVYYSSLGRQISDINSYTGYASFSESKGGKIFGVSTSSGTIASTNNDFFLVDASGDRISSIYSAKNFDPDKAGLDLFGNTLRQNFEYIEVPLMLSYKFIDKKVDFNIMGGMSYSFLLDNAVYAVSEGSVVPIGTVEDMAGLLLSSALGMSMQYSLNDKFSLNLEPSIRYFLNSDGSLSASNNPFTFGIFSGVYYKF